ncbi:glucose-6-phosphate dehydrogenase assembly protein OpcA [Singulisphaera sp. PoT]|uniref:glucose-6-phosphate dehydrogenase assembly protein OpcA n=1 Tax=Singulisphaera sp. PoT TaxID=3411797 RepID=UPI003BF58860
MAESASDAFLSGQGVPVTDLQDVETELTRLWGPAAERVGGPDLENPHVTRVALANLVVVTRGAECGSLRDVLDGVTARYPCRAIVVCLSDRPGRSIAAEVSALCHLPAPGLPQVCSERIVLRAGDESIDLVAGAVRPLLEADLPFVLWWTSDPLRDEALFRDLASECSRLLLDLPDPAAETAALKLGFDPAVTSHGRDVAWCGLTRWRELVAQFFDPPFHHEIIGRLNAVKIEVAAPSLDGAPRPAIWLAAWLAGQLGWKPQGTPDRSPGRLAATFQGPSGPVKVEIVTEVVPGLESSLMRATTLTAKAAEGVETFGLRRVSDQSGEVRINVSSPSYCCLPRMVLAPEPDHIRRVSAALESSRDDPPFRHALPLALWLLEA